MNREELIESFPLGSKVIATETFRKGEWAGGRLLKEDRTTENIGITEDYTVNHFGDDCLCVKVHLLSGDLFDSKTYDHPHVWHPVNKDNTTIELIE